MPIQYDQMDSLHQHSVATLRAEIDSLFAAQTPEPIRMISGMESEYFYFIVVLVFALLGIIIFGGQVFYKAILSFKKDLKELAKMKGDFVQLATLIKTEMVNRQRSNEDAGMRSFNPTDTQVMVPQKELRRLRALERVYQDNTENLIEKKTNLLDEGQS